MDENLKRQELGLPIVAKQPKEQPYLPLFQHEQSLLNPKERANYKKAEDIVLKPWLDHNSGLGTESWEQAPGYVFLTVYLKLVLNNRKLSLTKEYVNKTAPDVLFLVQEALNKVGGGKFVPDQLNDIAEIVKNELLERKNRGEIEV